MKKVSFGIDKTTPGKLQEIRGWRVARRAVWNTRGCLRLAAFSLVLFALHPTFAQQTTPPRLPSSFRAAAEQSGFVLKVQTNVVLVDVRVWDRRGNPVTDLKPGDFTVVEDGVEQKITSFSLENVEQLAQATGENGPPSVIDLGKLPANMPPTQVAETLQNHRLIVLFFDLTSMPVDDLMRALKAASNFVHKQMTPADLVAIATYSSDLRVARDFTNDRDALDQALQTIRVGEAASLAAAGAEGEAGTTNANGEEVVTQDVSAAFTPDETEFNIFNTDEKLAALQSLAEMLRGVPGRKAVIQFSSGIERTGEDNQVQLRATTDAANRSNVSFYTVDARGLVGLPPGGDASSASPAGTAVYTGSAISSQMSSLAESRETLAALSTDTGGQTFYDLNDFSSAFTQIQTENSTYYLLGYTPSNTRSDGRFRRIKVAVDRQGVKIEARPGYYAPKNFRQYTREDKDLQLEQAMDLDTPFVDLPLAVATAYFREPDGKFYVVLAAKIPGSAVSFLRKSKTHQTEFDFVWRATDGAGHPVAMLRDTLPVKLNLQTYQQVRESNILYEGGFVLPPGNYKLKVVARENESGRLGTFEEPLALPATTGSGLLVSSVVVSNQLQDLTAVTESDRRSRRNRQPGPNPLALGSHSILPSVTRVFRTNQSLYVYLESYASKPAKNTAGDRGEGASPSPPSVALVFFRGGLKISEAGPFPGQMVRSAKGQARYFVKIPLDKFPPGRYWMQVNVLDPSADQVAFARLPLAIMKAPAAGAAQGGR